MFPIRVIAGYSRQELDSRDIENTYNSFIFGGRGGISFLPFEHGSIDLLLICFYSIGNFTGDSGSGTIDRDYNRLDICATIGLSLWF